MLGMIERVTSNYRLEICLNNSRSESTLIELIKKHIAPGTILFSDCWKGYINLEKHGYKHLSVNHSENFVDPETRVHTQTIESSWRPMRRRLRRGGIRVESLSHLGRFLW